MTRQVIVNRHMNGMPASLVLAALLLAFVPPVRSEESQPVETLDAEAVVRQLRTLPSPMPPPPPLPAAKWVTPDPTEALRSQLYDRLLALYPTSIPALAQALRDPDVAQRRNAAQALDVLAGGWWRFNGEKHNVDIAAAMPALVKALDDSDSLVRAWAAGDLGYMGPRAVAAVPALIRLLGTNDEASKNGACIGLWRIGPAARAALPALNKTLSDPSADVRRLAGNAIKSIEVQQQ
jgi:HEAT repeat protein